MDAKEAIKSLTEMVEKVKSSMSSTGEIANEAKAQLDNFTKGIADQVLKSKDLNATFETLKSTVENFSSLSSFMDAFPDIKEIAKNAGFASDSLIDLGAQLAAVTVVAKSLPQNPFEGMTKSSTITNSKLAEMSTSIANAAGAIPGFGEGIKKIANGIGAFAQQGEAARDFEKFFISSAAATGQLSEAIDVVGDNFENITNKGIAFAELMENIGNSTGLASKDISAFAKDMITIPGAMDNFNGSAEKTVEGMHFLDAAVTVSQGTGIGWAKTFEIMKKSFDSFGSSGKGVIENIASLQQVSDATNTPLDKMLNYVEQTTGSFEKMGDNVQGAINIFGKLGPALQQAGMGPQAITNLVSNLTQSLANLNTAQKAFLSSQTGGPGGLQGSFQIDLLMRQGKVDEVFDKVQENLKKQFGGRIVSLEEAAGDQAAAAQYQKQISLVKSSGIAKDDAGAQRILEALNKGDAKGLGDEIKKPQEALVGALTRGEKIQERQNSLLIQLNNSLEKFSMVASFGADGLRRAAEKALPVDAQKIARESQEVAERQKPVLGVGIDLGKDFEDVYTEAKNKTVNFARNIASKYMQGDADKASKDIDQSVDRKRGEQDINRAADIQKNQNRAVPTAQAQSAKNINLAFSMQCMSCGKKEMKSVAQEEAGMMIDTNNSSENNRSLVGIG